MTFVSDHWLPIVCLLAAVGLAGGAAISWRRHAVWPWQCYLPAVLLASFGVGAFDFFPEWWIGFTIFASAFGLFVFALIVVIRRGAWSVTLGYALAAIGCFGFGACAGASISDTLHLSGAFLISLRPQSPWWLVLLLLIPVLVWTSVANLISLGTTRRWVVLGLRSTLIALVTLALAETFGHKPADGVTVIFLWDRSYSMPPELQAGEDLREKRIFAFINDSVIHNNSRRRNDRVGVIVFGKEPRLELPPGAVPKLGFKRIYSQIDPSYTDLAAAMKLALASFPAGAGKRIVIISDGNENLGQALEQARIARQNGVEVDIVVIDAGRKQENEILIERLEAPPLTEKETRLPLRVVIRSFHPEVVVAQLNIRKVTFGSPQDQKKAEESPPISTEVKLRQGLNVYYFQQPGAKSDTAFAYEASVIPLYRIGHDGRDKRKGLPGDRVDNNLARVTVMTRGERAILVLESEPGRHKLLMQRLKAANPSMKIVSLVIHDEDEKEKRPRRNDLHVITKGDNERLATYLSGFDAVFLANLPADALTPEEQKVIRSHVHDQGSGLVMIGGNSSFGAGGWQNTEIEKALPVNMELKSMRVEGKSGLVLIMHASEMAEGNAWQRKIARLAVEKLNDMDWVGQIHWGGRGHEWHIPFQEVGPNRPKIMGLIDSMVPSDMFDVDPAFEMAHKELTKPERGLGTKHIILISDGDHWQASNDMLATLKRDKVTCTTVCITTHGRDEVRKMKFIADVTGGRGYHIKDPSELPAIYIKETRLLSQSWIYEGQFEPEIKGAREGPTDNLKDPVKSLYGFVRTTKKESNLVKVLIETPPIGKLEKYRFPILASWQYGLGKSVAFTSDARTHPDGRQFWDKDWAKAEDVYGPFWNQMVQWVLRPTESGKHLHLSTEQRDGRIRIIVETMDIDKSPLIDVDLKAGITTPGFKVKDDRKFDLKFEQKNAGVWEAEVSADEIGAYFIHVQAKWKKDGKEMIDTVRAGVSIPYSPEFAEVESNASLLEKIRSMTNGKRYTDNAEALERAARAAEVFREVSEAHASLQPLWPWLVFFAALCLLFDVAIRRIAIQPEAIWARAVLKWNQLRGQASTADSVPEFIERLRSRKASVGETIDKKKAAQKFEATEGASAGDIPVVASTAPPVDKPKPAPKPEEKEDDFERLMRAKRKAMEERDKDKK